MTRAPATARAPLHVGLLWHSATSGNLGVVALTVANLALARAAAAAAGVPVRFTLLAMRDARPPVAELADLPVVEIDRRALQPGGTYHRALRDLDLILDIGAGDSFAEIYGWKRFLFIWGSKELAHRAGVPLILSPQTVGPFTRPVYRQLARRALRQARAVVARDPKSARAAQELAPGLPVTEAADVAFVLPYDETEPTRRPRVGVNVSGLLLPLAARETYGLGYDYGDAMRRIVGGLLDRGDCDVLLISHATSTGDAADDDGAAADRFAAEFPQAQRVPDFSGPSAAKTTIAGLDFLVAARMHACIAAVSSGTACMPMAYSRKFSGLFGMLGYDHLVPAETDGAAAAAHAVLRAYDNRAALAADAARAADSARARLAPYSRLLEQEFAALAATRSAA